MTEFTDAAQSRFLEKLTELRTIREAAREAKVSRSAVYHRKARDKWFAKLMAAALKGTPPGRGGGLTATPARRASTARQPDAAAKQRAAIKRDMVKP